jgi:hypothetical protein
MLGEPSIDSPPGRAASPIGGSTPEATNPKPTRREELAVARALRTERRLGDTSAAAGTSGDQLGDGSVTLTTSHSPQQSVWLDGAWRFYTKRHKSAISKLWRDRDPRTKSKELLISRGWL